MEPSGTSLHKLAAQFVKHKRASAPVCRPQTGDRVCIAQTRPPRLLSVSAQGWLAVSDPRSRGRSAAEAVQVPGERTPPYSSISDARVVTRALVASLLDLAYDAFLSGSTPGRRARPVLASPKADGCTTGSGLARTPGRALAAEGPRPRQTARPGLADLTAL